MNQIPSTLLPAPPPAREAGRSPGDPPDAPFASVLEDQARTAAAEGRTGRSAADAARRGDDRESDAGERTPIREDADAAALVALLGGLPSPTVAAASDAAVAPPASGAPLASPPLGQLPDGTIPTGPAVPSAATSLPLGPVAADAASAVTGAAATAGVGPGVAQPALADGIAGANGTPAQQAPVERAASASGTTAPGPLAAAPNAPAATSAHPAAGTAEPAAATGDQPASGTPAPGAGTQQGSAAQPTPTAAPAAQPPAAPPANAPTLAPAVPGGVRLAEAVETVKLAFRAAADRGVAHARISLTPRELGGVEIHLKQTADGLVARVVAEHQAAAQLLHHAGAELRRSLEAQGLTLLRLDVESGAADANAGAGQRDLASGGEAGARTGDGTGANGARARGADPTGHDPAHDLLDPTATTTLALPNGALVDVLA